MSRLYTKEEMKALEVSAKLLNRKLPYLITCPWCEVSFEENCERVDVGVGGGGQQVTPNECPNCGASECGGYRDSADAEEKKRGWFKGREMECQKPA